MEKDDGHKLERELTKLPWLNFAYAIIVQACEDYRKALQERHMGTVVEVEYFLTSDWFDILVLGKVNGEKLIKEIKGE